MRTCAPFLIAVDMIQRLGLPPGSDQWIQQDAACRRTRLDSRGDWHDTSTGPRDARGALWGACAWLALLLLTAIPAAFAQAYASGSRSIDLETELVTALATGKRGLAVYFGQADCAYCERLWAVNLKDPDIHGLIQRHFVWIPLDIHAQTRVRTLDGQWIEILDWARQAGVDFTPSVLFYDARGQLALRLRGYYPPYQFRAALDYVAEGFYRRESFADYLARGNDRLVFDEGDLNPEPFFSPPPHILDRRLPAERPLAVFFERGNCHPCDLLHSYIRQRTDLQRRLAELDAVQLDLSADIPLATPDGQRLSLHRWAEELGIAYAPVVILFDRQGREIGRIDSVSDFERLDTLLDHLAIAPPSGCQIACDQSSDNPDLGIRPAKPMGVIILSLGAD